MFWLLRSGFPGYVFQSITSQYYFQIPGNIFWLYSVAILLLLTHHLITRDSDKGVRQKVYQGISSPSSVKDRYKKGFKFSLEPGTPRRRMPDRFWENSLQKRGNEFNVEQMPTTPYCLQGTPNDRSDQFTVYWMWFLFRSLVANRSQKRFVPLCKTSVDPKVFEREQSNSKKGRYRANKLHSYWPRQYWQFSKLATQHMGKATLPLLPLMPHRSNFPPPFAFGVSVDVWWPICTNHYLGHVQLNGLPNRSPKI